MSRESILANVKYASNKNRLNAAKLEYFDTMIYDSKNLLETYIQHQKANMANIILSHRQSIIHDINTIIHEHNITNVLCAKNILHVMPNSHKIEENLKTNVVIYEKNIDEIKEQLFSIEASILHAHVGVANLGIFGLSIGNDNPRLTSLVVKTCIVLLKKEDIVANLFEAFKILKTSSTQKLPSNIVFIAGPSRTADIELKTVFGVHGPQNIFIILYE